MKRGSTSCEDTPVSYSRASDTPGGKESEVAKGKKSSRRKIGRDSGTGRFIPVKAARRRKKTATVETI